MLSTVVTPPKLVWITGFGNPTRGLLVEWRKRRRGGREIWEGLIVHIVTYASQDGQEWSVRVDWMRENQFRRADG